MGVSIYSLSLNGCEDRTEKARNPQYSEKSFHLQAFSNENTAKAAQLKSICFYSALSFPADLQINTALYSNIDWLSWQRRFLSLSAAASSSSERLERLFDGKIRYSAARRRKVNTSLVHVFDTVVSVSDSDVTESSGSDKKISAVLTKHGCCNVNLNPPEET
ncbi:hypothetical protein AOLI_G00330360 [Acnodon oligacanthus]